MLSSSLSYAIKAVLYIAVNSSKDQRIRIRDISEGINEPSPYVAKLLQDLARNNVISSLKGPNGGFSMEEDQLEQPIIKIVEVIEGSSRYQNCLLSTESCNETHPCPLHAELGEIRIALMQKFNEITIAELARDVKLQRSFLI